jgi:tight adherence protein C
MTQARPWEWGPWAALAALAAGAAPGLWLRDLGRKRRRNIERDLPFVFDMMTLCVEAGLSVQGALQLAARSGPPGALRDALADALAEMRAGVSRTAAIKALAERSNSPLARNWAAAVAQAEALGISLGPVLRAQAAQCRGDRHARAEQLAMQAPVKMLLPLIGCIFPCTFIVLAFPIAVQLLQSVQ